MSNDSAMMPVAVELYAHTQPSVSLGRNVQVLRAVEDLGAQGKHAAREARQMRALALELADAAAGGRLRAYAQRAREQNVVLVGKHGPEESRCFLTTLADASYMVRYFSTSPPRRRYCLGRYSYVESASPPSVYCSVPTRPPRRQQTLGLASVLLLVQRDVDRLRLLLDVGHGRLVELALGLGADLGTRLRPFFGRLGVGSVGINRLTVFGHATVQVRLERALLAPSRVNGRRPHARQPRAVLERLELVGDARNGVMVLGLARELREPRELDRERAELGQHDVGAGAVRLR